MPAKPKFFKKIVSKIFQKELQEVSSSIIKNAKMYSNYGGNHSSGQKYYKGLSSSGTSKTIDHMTSRQNARNALYDTTQAKAIVERYADTVVDVGLKLKPTPMASVLGLDQERLEEWAEDVGERFHLWGMTKESDLSEVNNFYQNQRLYQTFQTRDNDIFIRFHYNRKKDLINPLQLQFIDPNQIRGYAFTNTYAQIFNDDGIIRNNGREIAYKIWYTDQKGKYIQETVQAKGSKSGKIFMIHGFNPEYAGQGRGYSKLIHALDEFEKITDFSHSHIVKAINQSSIFMYTQPSKDAPASNVMAGRAAVTLDADYYGDKTEVVDNTGEQQFQDHPVNWNSIPEATLDDPGSVYVANLQDGEDLKTFPNTAPCDNYNTFVDSFTAYLSASMSMPIEVLLMRFNQNYSASRGALILFWRVAQIWRNEMASDYLNPIYYSWISSEIASGRISAPGWSDPLMKRAWLMAEWMGAPLPNIDPLKEAKAKKEWVEMGAEDLDTTALEHNLSSGKFNRLKLKRQIPELTEVPWNKKKSLGG